MAITITQSGRRFKALVTITAGTPIKIAAGPDPIKADRVACQMLKAAAGSYGLLYDDVEPGTAEADIAATSGPPEQLAPSPDANTPGGRYSDAAEANGYLDLRNFALDGGQNGDTALFTAHLKI